MTRVILVDDHLLLREGIANVLDADGDVEVVGQAGSLKEARAVITKTSPEVVLMDVRLPDGDGIDLCSELKGSPIKVIVLTQFSADRIVLRAFRNGASGYVVKESDAETLRQAIRSVMAGATYVDPRVTDKVVSAATKGPGSKGPYGLTPQEVRVVELLPRGLSNAEIADALGISEETVKTHLRHALRKLQVEDRASAASLAIETGLA